MLFLGCDPDMHTMPFAWVDENLKVQRIFILKAGGVEHSALLDMSRVAGRMQECSFEKVGAYAVEAQEIYPSGPNKTKNPRNILHLGTAAGMALVACGLLGGTGYFPLPTQWKGQINKLAHHQRILHHAGITGFDVMGGKEPYCVPHDRRGHNKGDWKHIMDAIGLAQYAATRYLDEHRKQKYLTQARNPKPEMP